MGGTTTTGAGWGAMFGPSKLGLGINEDELDFAGRGRFPMVLLCLMGEDLPGAVLPVALFELSMLEVPQPVITSARVRTRAT